MHEDKSKQFDQRNNLNNSELTNHMFHDDGNMYSVSSNNDNNENEKYYQHKNVLNKNSIIK